MSCVGGTTSRLEFTLNLSIFQDVVAELEEGILVERQCAQLVEQHEAAQDWLREQVRSLPAPPEETEALHGAVNTLKVSKQ